MWSMYTLYIIMMYLLNRSKICLRRTSPLQREDRIVHAIFLAARLLRLNNIPLSQVVCFKMAAVKGAETGK